MKKLSNRLWRAVSLLILIPLFRVFIFRFNHDTTEYSILGGQNLNDFIYFFSEDIIKLVFIITIYRIIKFLAIRYPSACIDKLKLFVQGVISLAVGKCIDEFTFPTATITIFEIIYILIVSSITYYRIWKLTHPRLHRK